MAQITIGLRSESDVKRGVLPWSVWKNPGGPENQPAFPCVRDGSGLPDGADIVCETLGDSDECKANAALIVEAVNSHDTLKRQRDALVVALEEIMRCELGIGCSDCKEIARAALTAAKE